MFLFLDTAISDTHQFKIKVCALIGSMYVCIYVCMYVHTYIHTYVRTYVCVCMYVYVCMYVRMYVRTYVCTVQLNSNLTLVFDNSRFFSDFL